MLLYRNDEKQVASQKYLCGRASLETKISDI
jgi:hypothetical protein